MQDTILELARTLHRQKSAGLLIRESLDRIEKTNPKLLAFRSVFAEQAIKAADLADWRAAEAGDVGMLHGIPFAIKDLAELSGHVTGFGSLAFGSKTSTQTAPAIQHLIDAGAIAIGTTHMVEFANGSWGTNHALGTPWNPIDMTQHRVPGGSSSGSAVAVAAGLVPFAIGSDTGGSIRIPASLCGIVGFKPSYGLIPVTGTASLGPTFDTLGPMTRSVADARTVFEIMARDAVLARADKVGTATLAVVFEEQLGALSPVVDESFARAKGRLSEAGFRLKRYRLPLSLRDYQSLVGTIVSYEIYQSSGHLAEDESLPMDPHVRRRVLAGRDIPEQTYLELLAERERAVTEFRSSFIGFDALLTPTTPLPAVPIDEVNEEEIPMSRFTRVGNYLDLCAITLPMQAPAGEVTGLQLLALSGQDRNLLDLASKVEGILRGQ
ncbi:amidase (plasmid) [Peteryoungia desertarenae]|uniref:Indoleacetamide hydrolase n=1 Tax=Peteryoungia desertarenae TaxID=1813451 RepID=A0ABX6QSI9_9HYPH|nr:amidase [Peteryoungia desertarenae]QLF71474.1 amidase [Peteryoungia desertarenae]